MSSCDVSSVTYRCNACPLSLTHNNNQLFQSNFMLVREESLWVCVFICLWDVLNRKDWWEDGELVFESVSQGKRAATASIFSKDGGWRQPLFLHPTVFVGEKEAENNYSIQIRIINGSSRLLASKQRLHVLHMSEIITRFSVYVCACFICINCEHASLSLADELEDLMSWWVQVSFFVFMYFLLKEDNTLVCIWQVFYPKWVQFLHLSDRAIKK